MKIPINKWSEADRPREKLLTKGVRALTDAELIAILIGSGNRQESAVALSQRILLAADNNLEALGVLTVKDLIKFKGIGEAKAISIVAALELGKRRNLTQALQRKEIRSSRDAFELLSPNMSDLTTEEFWVIIMKKNQVAGVEKFSAGGLDASLVDIRLLMKLLLEKEATAFIVAHNHPSGNDQPSVSDKDLTRKIKEASKLLQIHLLDHIIVAKRKYFSFADNHIL